MKNQYALFILISGLFCLSSCNDSAPASEGTEHEQLVQKGEEFSEQYKKLVKRLEELREQNDDLSDKFSNTTSPDSAAMASIENYRNLLLNHYGTLQKQDQIFKTHKDYHHKHEKTAISPGEIMAQHARIKTDHEQMAREQSEIEFDLSRIENAMKTMQVEMQ